MGIFRKANKKLEGLVEGGFGRAFKSSVQPVELAHKLAKEMGDHKTVGVSNVYVPNEFDVYLGKDDSRSPGLVRGFAQDGTLQLRDRVRAARGLDPRRAAAHRAALRRRPARRRVRHRDAHRGRAGRDAGTPARSRPPAAAVPPAAAAAPGPVIDQTVLYQESAAAAGAAAPARASSARGVLRGRQGDYQLTEAVTVIGRSRRCDIVLTDANVSRQHAEIRKQDDGFMLLDLGSTNGTRVNRRDVKQVVLQHGDRIELGTTELLFERQP